MSKTFDKLTNDEKKALMGAWVDGAIIECLGARDSWMVVPRPQWRNGFSYRIKPEPFVQLFKSYGCINPAIHDKETQFVWYNYRNTHCTHRLTITMIDGVVSPNAVVEEL